MTAAKRLTQNVIVSAPAGSEQSFALFGPDSEDIPKWAADQIGDHAYEDVAEVGAPIQVSPETVEDEGDDESPKPAKKAAPKRSSN